MKKYYPTVLPPFGHFPYNWDAADYDNSLVLRNVTVADITNVHIVSKHVATSPGVVKSNTYFNCSGIPANKTVGWNSDEKHTLVQQHEAMTSTAEQNHVKLETGATGIATLDVEFTRTITNTIRDEQTRTDESGSSRNDQVTMTVPKYSAIVETDVIKWNQRKFVQTADAVLDGQLSFVEMPFLDSSLPLRTWSEWTPPEARALTYSGSGVVNSFDAYTLPKIIPYNNKAACDAAESARAQLNANGAGS